MSVSGTVFLSERGVGVELLSGDELFRIVEKENSEPLHEGDFRRSRTNREVQTERVAKKALPRQVSRGGLKKAHNP